MRYSGGCAYWTRKETSTLSAAGRREFARPLRQNRQMARHRQLRPQAVQPHRPAPTPPAKARLILGCNICLSAFQARMGRGGKTRRRSFHPEHERLKGFVPRLRSISFGSRSFLAVCKPGIAAFPRIPPKASSSAYWQSPFPRGRDSILPGAGNRRLPAPRKRRSRLPARGIRHPALRRVQLRLPQPRRRKPVIGRHQPRPIAPPRARNPPPWHAGMKTCRPPKKEAHQTI